MSTGNNVAFEDGYRTCLLLFQEKLGKDNPVVRKAREHLERMADERMA